MADRVGQQFGDYRLVRLIGKGGFADVYLGEHMRRKTLTAVKVLHARLAQDNLKSFLNEARSFRLKHAHIIQILDFGLEDDFPYLVMEYAPSGSLRQRYPKGTRLPLATIVSYVAQLADALQYAHGEGVIHRDIKPDNMLVGQRGDVLLSDFGIASIAQTATSLDLRDQAGTITYMSPEQMQGKPRPASDQYSLGIVIYEWICGDRPFHGTFAEIHGQHLTTLPPSLRARVPDLPVAVEQVVMIALAKDYRSRFASIKAFASALGQAYQAAQSFEPTIYPANNSEPTIYPASNLAPKAELPVEIKPIRQMAARPPAIQIEHIPSAGAHDAAEAPKQPLQPTPSALPPVTDYTPSRSQPSPGTFSMPVASPDTYTISRPSATPPASSLPVKKKRHWFF
ncbi:MAG TPA: protein kinase [Ktedonobacteraceae bacterium]|nr:protein kinase [Ktedonobacteraceae bacterium]